MTRGAPHGAAPRHPLLAAASLALASAVSLGMARFSYALLLPPMREDLHWSYLTAGAMNTVNAAGYLLGALLMPAAMRRLDARTLMLAGGALAALAMALHGAVRGDAALYTLRLATGMASAASFVAGGLLAARLASLSAGVLSPGIVLGLYYGGTGVGIVGSAWIVPPWVTEAASGWPQAWWALAALCAVLTVLTAAGTGALAAPPQAGAARQPVSPRPLAWALAGYAMFGLGYIGYMTFVITLLRELGLPAAQRTAFFVLLGLGVVASSWLWAPLLQRWRGGGTMALLNALLAVATLLLVTRSAPWVVFASGALFGAVFLQVVGSTTALVRHNLPPAQWPAGIALFTIVFAAGQIVGPSLVGWVADGPGGLQRGFALSAGLLALGSVLASRQRPVPPATSAAPSPAASD